MAKDDSDSFESESNVDVSLYHSHLETGKKQKILSRDDLNEHIYIVAEGQVTAGIDILG